MAFSHKGTLLAPGTEKSAVKATFRHGQLRGRKQVIGINLSLYVLASLACGDGYLIAQSRSRSSRFNHPTGGGKWTLGKFLSRESGPEGACGPECGNVTLTPLSCLLAPI